MVEGSEPVHPHRSDRPGRQGRIMDRVAVPPEFRERVSDDGRQARLAEMQLESVPEWLGNLSALTTLDLSDNELESVPGWLGNLTALTKLYLFPSCTSSLTDWRRCRSRWRTSPRSSNWAWAATS
jgi:hypothetical protein